MSRKTIRKKLVALTVMVAMLFGVYTALPPRYGSALSNSAIDTTIATMTDIPLTPIVPGENEATATSTTQVKNILAVVETTRDDLDHIHFEVFLDDTVSTDTHWWSYNYNSCITPGEIYVNTFPDSDQSADITIQADSVLPEDTPLVYCYFNSTDTYNNAIASIKKDFLGGYTLNNTWVNATDESVLDMSFIMVGDVNGNNAIGVDDALMILQFVSNDLIPTDAQRLAADCDRDGEIEATDAVQIQKYVVGKVCSLWDDKRIQLPTEHSNSLIDGFVYRLKNKATGEYLSMNKTNTSQACAVSDYDPTEQYAKFELRKVANQSYYTLRNKSNNTTLRLDNNYQVSFDNTTNGFIAMSGYWYLIPVEEGYEMVSYPVQNRALTTYGEISSSTLDCRADYAARGTVWILEGPSITISYHYDGGYDQRCTDDDIAGIGAHQQKIATILENVFHANVTLIDATDNITTSRADGCSYGINANCSHIGATNCLANSEKSPYNTSHHKNANDMLLYWHQQLPLDVRGKTIHILYSGHVPCLVTDEDDDGINDTHKSPASGYILNGVTYVYQRVATVFVNNFTNQQYVETLTALHEISHDLGAWDDTSPADSDHGECVLSYNRSNSTMHEKFNSNSLSNHKALYCVSCYNAIVTFLAQNY